MLRTRVVGFMSKKRARGKKRAREEALTPARSVHAARIVRFRSFGTSERPARHTGPEPAATPH